MPISEVHVPSILSVQTFMLNVLKMAQPPNNRWHNHLCQNVAGKAVAATKTKQDRAKSWTNQFSNTF